jgi:hypothetical protein
MKRAIVTLESVSNYSQSRHYDEETVPKLKQELFNDYEKRTWRHRMHVNEGGYVFIPPMALKNCLSEAAKYKSEKIAGKGNTTYTKKFESGILVVDPLVLPIKAEDVPGEWLFLPPDGIRGSGKRVNKCFPLIAHWAGEVTFYILDEIITEEIFVAHLKDAGSFIGVGRFRPSRNGFYGRFTVKKVIWEAVES